QDAAYMITVPNIVAHVQHLPQNPVICYVRDDFQRPVPFRPDVVVGIDETVALKWDMLHCHTSQMYEWLPFNGGYANEVPGTDNARRDWLIRRRASRDGALADRFRQQLVERYGEERGRSIRYAEAFEVSEYGARLTTESRAAIFPPFVD
ncbi:MAG: PIG-L family deacetylase, partial [Chloroflexi bacterium]|nr:PIG-L family deacetylase [Chloroflexota bacterium]